jgi:preprotein translocase subunit SecD
MSQSPMNRVQPMPQSRSRSPVLSRRQEEEQQHHQSKEKEQISTHKSTLSPAASFRRRHSERHSLACSPRSEASTSFREKEELQSLNDRLALIIQRVRKLESENVLLRAQVSRQLEELNEGKRERTELVKERAMIEIELIEQKACADLALEKRDKLSVEVQELVDLKELMDSEVLLYRKILESEEQRVNDSLEVSGPSDRESEDMKACE